MLEPLTDDDPPRVGPFTLEGRLGPALYLGRAAGHAGAVRLVPAAWAGDPDFRRRVAALGETVIGADLEAENPWLATEYVASPSPRGPLPAAEALELTAAIADALAALHAKGLTHGNLTAAAVKQAPAGVRLVGADRPATTEDVPALGELITFLAGDEPPTPLRTLAARCADPADRPTPAEIAELCRAGLAETPRDATGDPLAYAGVRPPANPVDLSAGIPADAIVGPVPAQRVETPDEDPLAYPAAEPPENPLDLSTGIPSDSIVGPIPADATPDVPEPLTYPAAPPPDNPLDLSAGIPSDSIVGPIPADATPDLPEPITYPAAPPPDNPLDLSAGIPSDSIVGPIPADATPDVPEPLTYPAAPPPDNPLDLSAGIPGDSIVGPIPADAVPTKVDDTFAGSQPVQPVEPVAPKRIPPGGAVTAPPIGPGELAALRAAADAIEAGGPFGVSPAAVPPVPPAAVAPPDVAEAPPSVPSPPGAVGADAVDLTGTAAGTVAWLAGAAGIPASGPAATGTVDASGSAGILTPAGTAVPPEVVDPAGAGTVGAVPAEPGTAGTGTGGPGDVETAPAGAGTDTLKTRPAGTADGPAGTAASTSGADPTETAVVVVVGAAAHHPAPADHTTTPADPAGTDVVVVGGTHHHAPADPADPTGTGVVVGGAGAAHHPVPAGHTIDPIAYLDPGDQPAAPPTQASAHRPRKRLLVAGVTALLLLATAFVVPLVTDRTTAGTPVAAEDSASAGAGPVPTGPTCAGARHLAAGGSALLRDAMVTVAAQWAAQCRGSSLEYTPGGSGFGAEQFAAGEADFAVADHVLGTYEGEIAAAAARCAGVGAPADKDLVLQVPLVLTPVVLTYNLPGLSGLRLDAKALAAIFSGRLTRWNDPVLARLNPGTRLPRLPITPVARADETLSTETFQQFLTAVGGWRSGDGAEFTGRTRLPQTSDSGVLAAVRSVEGAIGYLPFPATQTTGEPVVSLVVGDGVTAAPGSGTVHSAVNTAVDDAVDYTHLPGAIHHSGEQWSGEGTAPYPLVHVGYVVACTQYPDDRTTGAVRDFLLTALSVQVESARGYQLPFGALRLGLVDLVQRTY